MRKRLDQPNALQQPGLTVWMLALPPTIASFTWGGIRTCDWPCTTARLNHQGTAIVRHAASNQPAHADDRITLQKLPAWKCGSLSASTSAFTLPNVVSGLCLIPS
ncbi:hypothetical protein BLA17378_07413 [Burkholderia aenigmatica]|uniref:Secreted protein n=1 Tax=Burkholderia aenigmatica TaxID=2015348 RepID=A0ABY6Y3Y3_9BURK|nr:hypothetical protein BLA17378_07413 [Burkholderia aenigmatica]